MRVTWDALTNMGYLYLVDAIEPGSAVETVECESLNSVVYLDFDTSGVLIGIEFPRASHVMPKTLLAQANKPGAAS